VTNIEYFDFGDLGTHMSRITVEVSNAAYGSPVGELTFSQYPTQPRLFSTSLAVFLGPSYAWTELIPELEEKLTVALCHKPVEVTIEEDNEWNILSD
jgi:hypothetical protein